MRSRKRFPRLARWVTGCGQWPLIAALAMWVSVRVEPFAASLRPGAEAAVVADARPADFEIIDAVLAQRAPDLGLTLRHQLGVAIAEEARRAGYDPLLILAIINVESDFDEEAVSSKGARGLMQIQPTTLYFLAQQHGLRLSRDEVATDPALQVRLGIRYLRNLNDRFGNLDLALMAYNAGPAKIRRALQSGEADVFRRYPSLVRRDFRSFREGEGLGGDWALARRDRPALP
jgi:soluble lytic murein transglycosylase